MYPYQDDCDRYHCSSRDYDKFRNQISRPVMRAEDYVISRVTDNELFALGRMLSYNMKWPPVISHKGVSYAFISNEVMPDSAVGNYHGYARFQRIHHDC